MTTTSQKAPKYPASAAPSCRPDWLPQTEAALRALLELQANWNSYGARTIRPEVVDKAADLLRSIAQSSTPPPAIVPTVRGGVQVEWHTHVIDLEIEIEQPGQFQVLYEESGDEVELEAEMTLADLPRLRELTGRPAVSQRRGSSPGGM